MESAGDAMTEERELEPIEALVGDTPGKAVTLTELSSKLGVTFQTAGKRLQAYAASRGLELRQVLKRVGARGPASAAFYVVKSTQPKSADSSQAVTQPPPGSSEPTQPPPGHLEVEDEVTVPGPLVLQVRKVVMERLPRDQAKAVSTSTLLQQVLADLRAANEGSVKMYAYRILKEEGTGIVRDSQGRLYLEEHGSRRRSGQARPNQGESVATRKVRSIEELIDSGGDGELGIPDAVAKALHGDELLALRVLGRVGSARASELAERIGRSVGRLPGLMTTLRRKLHTLGYTLYVCEPLPGGETLYRFVGKGSR